VLHTWPLASAPTTFGRVNNAHTALNAWGAIAWVGMSLLRDPMHLFHANIFYPDHERWFPAELRDQCARSPELAVVADEADPVLSALRDGGR
jgi:hypothetical protein